MTYDVYNPSNADPVGRYIIALHASNTLQADRPLPCDKISIRNRKRASKRLSVAFEAAQPHFTDQIKSDIYNMMYSRYPVCYTPREYHFEMFVW